MNRFMLGASLLRWSVRASMVVGLQVALTGASAAQDVPPLAFDGGPYAGSVGVAVAFNGTGSFDADGDALSYSWDFGDGGVGTGAVTSHVYAAAGNYLVRLTVSANGLSSSDETVAQIGGVLEARAFAFPQEVGRLSQSKPATVRIESGGGFGLSDVNPAEVWMRLPSGGASIRAIPSSVVIDGDRDHNGVTELRASFAKTDLRRLLSGASNSEVIVTGQLRSGPWFAANLTLPVSGGATTVQAALVNDPAAGTAVLELAAAGGTGARIDVFDVRGRLLRSVSGAGSAGRSVDLADAVRRSGGGGRGIYFYRVVDAEGSHRGRFVLLR